MTLSEMKKLYNSTILKLSKASTGRLVVSECRGTLQYYKYIGNNKKSYIPSNNKKEIMELAQKLYNERVVKVLEQQIKCIEQYTKNRDPNCLIKVYNNLPKAIQELIVPYELPIKEYVANWERQSYKTKKHIEGDLLYKTDKGDMVRSKSEVIIANKLHSMNIPYRYECELNLNNRITMYPDFTILNKTNRKEFFLEHIGMIDDVKYANNFVRKINTYAEAGILLGDNLFCTFESSQNPLNIKTLEKMINNFFI